MASWRRPLSHRPWAALGALLAALEASGRKPANFANFNYFGEQVFTFFGTFFIPCDAPGGELNYEKA